MDSLQHLGAKFAAADDLLAAEETMSTLTSTASAPPAPKRKRGIPGNPDPDAEVIALSPKTLMATNRFVCEVCNKGFQRDQNLQLHRRGHNLPWKLKQRANKDGAVRKKVYTCPEVTCVHHDPSRALGDLTGIKKHYFRKHGEKRWKCDKCSKKYAVHSDWKAHVKVCGTREYRCDCGTLFSRRDSFITHRAFCDALTEETAKAVPATTMKQQHEQTSLGSTTDEQLQEEQSSFLVKPELHPYPWAQYSSVEMLTAASLAPLSATALLQKAAQMGATTSQAYSQMATHDSTTATMPYAIREGLTRDFLGLTHVEMMRLAALGPHNPVYRQHDDRGKQAWLG